MSSSTLSAPVDSYFNKPKIVTNNTKHHFTLSKAYYNATYRIATLYFEDPH